MCGHENQQDICGGTQETQWASNAIKWLMMLWLTGDKDIKHRWRAHLLVQVRYLSLQQLLQQAAVDGSKDLLVVHNQPGIRRQRRLQAFLDKLKSRRNFHGRTGRFGNSLANTTGDAPAYSQIQAHKRGMYSACWICSRKFLTWLLSFKLKHYLD